MSVMVLPMLTPKTCPTLEAGSVLTSSTFFPARARVIALAQAMEVFPTPPLPVKNRNRGASFRNFIALWVLSAAGGGVGVVGGAAC